MRTTTLRRGERRQRVSGGGQRWIFSYADVLTILLVLFVAIAAHGLSQSYAAAAPQPAPPESRQDLRQTRQALEERGLKPKVEARGLVVTLPQAILFQSGKDEVDAGALPVVGEVAEAIRGIPNKVIIVGHADAVPIHNRRFRDNWMLSVARGLSLLEALKGNGIPESRLSVAGYGSYSPLASNETEESRTANRRVEIVILRAEKELREPSQ